VKFFVSNVIELRFVELRLIKDDSRKMTEEHSE
jgi:hypothetical protein